MSTLQSSPREAELAIHRQVIEAGEPCLQRIETGQVVRILDLKGNQAVDTLFYGADEPEQRYDATATIAAQSNLYLTTGSVLMSNQGREMLKIVADTCGRHDTIGGACSAESNTVRYALEKRHMHACRDSFLMALSDNPYGLDKRDLSSNINFFMNVPVSPEGDLHFADGISAAGRYVELQALMPIVILISNCPQLNNPCNAYNPTPVELLVWER